MKLPIVILVVYISATIFRDQVYDPLGFFKSIMICGTSLDVG